MSDSRRVMGITAVILIVMGLLCWGTIAVGVKVANRFPAQETTVSSTHEAEDHYPGLLITAVLPNSPAALVGVKSGHIILSANGMLTNQIQQLQKIVDAQAVDAEITLVLLVDRVQQQAVITRRAERPFLGVQLIENDVNAADFITTAIPVLPEPSSEHIPFEPVIVGKVLPNTPAEKVGLEVGDVLTAVDGASILNSAELITHLANKNAGNTITLTFRRGADTLTRTVTLISHPENEIGGFLGIELQAN